MTNQEPNIVEKIRAQKSIGIQIGVESFMDEGVEQVLDILQEKVLSTLFIFQHLRMTGVLEGDREGHSRIMV